MKKDIRDYLHLYLGCSCILPDFSEKINNIKFKLTAYNYNYYKDWHSEIQPILRPLSSMTEEEKKEFILICELEPEDVSCVEYNTYFPGNAKSLGAAHLTNVLQWAKGVNYLRKQGIDCDGLIDAGLALDITKQPAQ